MLKPLAGSLKSPKASLTCSSASPVPVRGANRSRASAALGPLKVSSGVAVLAWRSDVPRPVVVSSHSRAAPLSGVPVEVVITSGTVRLSPPASGRSSSASTITPPPAACSRKAPSGAARRTTVVSSSIRAKEAADLSRSTL